MEAASLKEELLGGSDEGAGAGAGEDIRAEAVHIGEPEPPPGHEEEEEDASMLGDNSLAESGPAQGEDSLAFEAGPESGPAQGEGEAKAEQGETEASKEQQQEQPAAVVSCKLEPVEPADSALAAGRQLHQLPPPVEEEEPAQLPPLKKVKLELDAPAADQPNRKRPSLATSPSPGPAAVATPCRRPMRGQTVRSPAFPPGTRRPRPHRHALADLMTGVPSKGKLTLQPKDEDDNDDDDDLFEGLFGSDSENEGTPRHLNLNVKTEGSGSSTPGAGSGAKKRKSPPGLDHQEVEVCIGCQRRYCKSACYFEGDKIVKWNSQNGNLYWCYDCVRVFSTCYKDRTTQNIFGSDPAGPYNLWEPVGLHSLRVSWVAHPVPSAAL